MLTRCASNVGEGRRKKEEGRRKKENAIKVMVPTINNILTTLVKFPNRDSETQPTFEYFVFLIVQTNRQLWLNFYLREIFLHRWKGQCR